MQIFFLKCNFVFCMCQLTSSRILIVSNFDESAMSRRCCAVRILLLALRITNTFHMTKKCFCLGKGMPLTEFFTLSGEELSPFKPNEHDSMHVELNT